MEQNVICVIIEFIKSTEEEKQGKVKALFRDQLKRYAEDKGLSVTEDFTACDKCAGKVKYWAKTHGNETSRLDEERSDLRNNNEEEILNVCYRIAIYFVLYHYSPLYIFV